MPLLPATTPSPVPLSTLFVWDQFVNKYGYRNIIIWSNKDSTQSNNSVNSVIPTGQPNWYAVQDAFNFATEDIYDKLRGGILKVPLDFTPNGGIVPAKASRWAMTIARAELMEVRFSQDKDTSKSAKLLEKQLDAVYGELAGYRSGQPGFQMPEAVHNTDTGIGIVTAKDVYLDSASVRFIDGTFRFGWAWPA